MRILRAMVPLLCFVLFASLSAPPKAKADEFNKLTIFTFSGPFEIPGYKGPMVLPAGTYVFKLLDVIGNRDIVQVFNKDQTHLYSTILAITDYRMKPTDKSVITFEERAAGSPEAVKAWFYPGSLSGEEFVYPKARAVELAKRTNQPVLSMPEETSSNMAKPIKSANESAVAALEKAPVKAQKPSGEEVEMVEVIPPPPPAARTRLPKTASSLPLWGLVGLLLCMAGVGLRMFSRRAA